MRQQTVPAGPDMRPGHEHGPLWSPGSTVRRTRILGGPINEYRNAA
ncbi:hypothetical protein AB1484_22800 [Parafrankia sp. FMc6]